MKKLGVLVLVFLVCFLGTLVIRNQGFSWGRPQNIEAGFKPEKYELQDNPIENLDKMSTLQRLDEERTVLINAIIPSVVCISTEGLQRPQSEQAGASRVRDIGSGVIVSHQGHIVTNNHVISGKDRLNVTLHDGRELEAKLIGTDPTLDIAVLRVETDGVELQPLKFGDSDEVRVGQMVFAVGNPFGLGEAVTQGIISAKERSFSDEQRDLFQTDAAINPGNSGGPLINTQGEVIGINVSIYSAEKGQPNSQGVGFSLPSNEVMRSFEQIAEKGHPVRAFMGVSVQDLTPEGKTFLGYRGNGVTVREVTKGSPAAEAGVLPRDVILSYDGKKVEGSRQLLNMILRSSVDEEKELVVLRQGEKVKLKAMVIDSMDWKGSQETIKDEEYEQMIKRVELIGLRVRDLEWIEKRRGGDVGVVVSAIAKASYAAKMGLKQGDRVISIDKSMLRSAEQFYQTLIDEESGAEITMVVQRNNSQVAVRLKL